MNTLKTIVNVFTLFLLISILVFIGLFVGFGLTMKKSDK